MAVMAAPPVSGRQVTTYANVMRTLVATIVSCCCGLAVADESFTTTYDTLVDDSGNITLPKSFRTDWTFLGTWSIALEDVEDSSNAGGHGAAGLHNVYTQRGVAEAFRRDGMFPDGAVVVKELLKGVTTPMTTGTVSSGSEVEGWFVMVKDTQQRFGTNPLWGDGWGWVLFGPDGQAKTTNYKAECLGCHIPAKSSDWIYTHGYPVLH